MINGQDIVPVSPSWAILLTEFIRQVNKYRGRPIGEQEAEKIVTAACRGVRKVFPMLPRKRVSNDIYRIMDTFSRIARGEEPDDVIGYMSIGEYAPYMRAPHRMDLMVSAMTRDGKWHCNQKCVHCYAAGQVHSDEKELGTSEWMRILDRCRMAGIPQVTFTGGEPTMRNDLVELIEHAKWFVTRLNTNGTNLTRELCERLHAASLDSMQITFYSADKDIHNKLVGAGRYDDTVTGIKNALDTGINVSINTPLCTLNRDYVKTLEFLHDLGVIYVTCSGLITTGCAAGEESTSLQLSEDEIQDILIDAAAYCFKNGMEISFTSPGWIDTEVFGQLGLSTPTCGACLSNMAVTPGGNIVPCQSWLSGDILGNMLTDDWDTVWNSPACAERRAESARMMGVCPLRRTK